jgi:hypothetical protein
MESFRTEIEDPIVQNEIIDLERKLRYSKMAKLMMSVFVVRLARVFTVSVKKAFK